MASSRRSQADRRLEHYRRGLLAVLFAITAVALFPALYVPDTLGLLGFWLNRLLLRLLGWPAYIVPAVLGWSAWRAWRCHKRLESVFLFSLYSYFLPLAGFLLIEGTWGLLVTRQSDIAGRLPAALAQLAIPKIGMAGAGLALGAFWAVWLWLAFDVPWAALMKKAVVLIYEDWKSWRKEAALKKSLAQRSGGVIAGETVLSPGISMRAKAKEELLRDVAVPGITAIETVGSFNEAVAKKKKLTNGTAPGPALAAAAASSGQIWKLPSLELLKTPDGGRRQGLPQEYLMERGEHLVRTMASFDVAVDLSGIVPGPVVTRYDVTPKPGVKVSEIDNLSNDIALAMKTGGVRVLGPIAGRGAIGIEVPNPEPKMVRLREVLEDPAALSTKGSLVFMLGRSASGEAVTCDLTDMPHILVAGATGSGKSILIHTMIVSLLYRLTPEQLKFVLIDPKRLELPFYDKIPHLFDPRKPAADVKVVTDSKEASKTISTMVDLMEARYERFAKRTVRNIEAYNAGSGIGGYASEPYVVVVIDELADLMLVAGKEVEHNIQRLAQMARAVGIHLVLATQRPSVDVITGVIKANLPARVALQVVSKMDSRVILDAQGAEDLLGAGDMLYLASGAQRAVRLQGAYIGEEEISRVVRFWSEQGPPQYPEPAELLGLPAKTDGDLSATSRAEVENLVKALRLVQERRRVSQDLLKANFGSSARATDLLSRLELGGFIFKPEGTNRWEIRYDRIEEFLHLNERQEN
ncbi:MAG: DNA translocase FtsK 4TM domain-containing protein [Elusimicrobia bacterium]|nr:DNA translocase FtsK 4TM domain-containing protein [Elusimicrobiota bacterium]